MTWNSPFSFWSHRSPSAAASTEMHEDFIPKLSPTIIRPWRTMIISYSWMIFSKNVGNGCRLRRRDSFSSAAVRLS